MHNASDSMRSCAHMKTTVLLALTSLAILGCSGKAITREEARGVPLSHVHQQDLLASGADRAEVTFIRDADNQLGSAYYQLRINGKPLAAVGQGEAVTVWLKPDVYSFVVGLSERANEVDRVYPRTMKTLELDARAERRYSVRMGWMRHSEISAFEARSEPKKP